MDPNMSADANITKSDEFKAKVIALIKSREQLKEQKAELISKLEEEKAQNAELQSQLAHLAASSSPVPLVTNEPLVQQSSDELDSLHAENDRLKAQLSEMIAMEAGADNNAQIYVVQEENKQLNNHIMKMNEQFVSLAALRVELDKLVAANNEMQVFCSDQGMRISELSAENQDLKNRLNSYDMQNQALIDLRLQLERTQKRNSDLQSANILLNEHIFKIVNQIGNIDDKSAEAAELSKSPAAGNDEALYGQDESAMVPAEGDTDQPVMDVFSHTAPELKPNYSDDIENIQRELDDMRNMVANQLKYYSEQTDNTEAVQQ